MLRRSILTAIFSLCCFSALPASAQFGGEWQVYARTNQTTALCVSLVGTESWYDFTLTQAGNFVFGSATRADTGAYFGSASGTAVGNTIDLSITDFIPGQTTTHVFSLTLDATGDVFTGPDNWVKLLGGQQSCGGQDSVVGSRRGRRFCAADQPGLCPCGNHLPAGTLGGCRNSQGVGAVIVESGFPSLSGLWSSYSMGVIGARPNQPALLLQGSVGISIPFKDGRLCMGNPTVRVEVATLDATGSATFSPLTPLVLGGIPIAPFSTKHHQVWYRDSGVGSPCGQGSNFSDALTVMFMP